MRFFKENSYDIVKLYINQIGISIFSMVLYTAVGTIDIGTRALNIGLSVFLMLFYFALIYTAAWEFGAKDKIRIDSGKMSRTACKGTFMSLFAAVPNFIIAGLCFITALIYKSTLSSALGVIAVLLNTLMRLSMAMYLGIIQAIFGSFTGAADSAFILQAVGFFVSPLLAVAVVSFGYSFGIRDKRIFGIFSANNKRK